MLWFVLIIVAVVITVIVIKKTTSTLNEENTDVTEPDFRPLNINHNKNNSFRVSDNPKFHRTKDEKNAFAKFSTKYYDTIKSYETAIYNDGMPWDENIGVDMRIAACKESIAAFDELKRFCYGKGGEIYFQDMWEHCHNSKEKCFSQGDKLKEQLDYLETHRDDLIYVEQQKPLLRSKLKDYISQNEGIIQKDIYKDFSPLLKSLIQSELYFMDKDGTIKRTKKGNSYIVELQK